MRTLTVVGALAAALLAVSVPAMPASAASKCGTPAQVSAAIDAEAAARPNVVVATAAMSAANKNFATAKARLDAAVAAHNASATKLSAATRAVTLAQAAVVAAKKTSPTTDDAAAARQLSVALAARNTAQAQYNAAAAARASATAQYNAAMNKLVAATAAHGKVFAAAQADVRAHLTPCVTTIKLASITPSGAGMYAARFAINFPVFSPWSDGWSYSVVDFSTGEELDFDLAEVRGGVSTITVKDLPGAQLSKLKFRIFDPTGTIRWSSAVVPVELSAREGADQDFELSGAFLPDFSMSSDANIGQLSAALSGFVPKSTVNVTVDGQLMRAVVVDSSGAGTVGPEILATRMFANGTHIVRTFGKKVGETSAKTRQGAWFVTSFVPAPTVVALKDPAADPSTEYGDTNFVFKMATGFEKANVFVGCSHDYSEAIVVKAVATNNDPADSFLFRYRAVESFNNLSAPTSPGHVCRLFTPDGVPASTRFVLPSASGQKT